MQLRFALRSALRINLTQKPSQKTANHFWPTANQFVFLFAVTANHF